MLSLTNGLIFPGCYLHLDPPYLRAGRIGGESHMKESIKADAEYLVRRHELDVARQHMPDLHRALIASDNAGLNGAIQALLRVIFGYTPEIKTVCTIGAVLDGFTEYSPGLVIFDDNINISPGIDLVSLIGENVCSSEIIVISRKRHPSDVLAMKQAGVADIIHPDRLDSARLMEAYIRACVFSELKDSATANPAHINADVIHLEPRSALPKMGPAKTLLHA